MSYFHYLLLLESLLVILWRDRGIPFTVLTGFKASVDQGMRSVVGTQEATRWLSWYGVGLTSADRLPVVVRIPAGPFGSLKCDPPKGNGRRPQKKLCGWNASLCFSIKFSSLQSERPRQNLFLGTSTLFPAKLAEAARSALGDHGLSILFLVIFIIHTLQSETSGHEPSCASQTDLLMDNFFPVKNFASLFLFSVQRLMTLASSSSRKDNCIFAHSEFCSVVSVVLEVLTGSFFCIDILVSSLVVVWQIKQRQNRKHKHHRHRHT